MTIEPELWTTAEAARHLGASSAGSGRKTLSRLGIEPVSREPGRGGQNLYDAESVRRAKTQMPGRGRRPSAGARLISSDALEGSSPTDMPETPPGTGPPSADNGHYVKLK